MRKEGFETVLWRIYCFVGPEKWGVAEKECGGKKGFFCLFVCF